MNTNKKATPFLEKVIIFIIFFGAMFAASRYYLEHYIDNRLSQIDTGLSIKVLNQSEVVADLLSKGYLPVDIAEYLELVKKIAAKQGTILIDRESVLAMPDAYKLEQFTISEIKAKALELNIKVTPASERYIPRTRSEMDNLLEVSIK
ncbi:hypothetical protein [Motilimonas eburnea]|uniref:hypothetical protein n=1 Tax=Motilimonas eburnea TaxID=1737488 RepID=UPI001E48B2C9|nr:hypothetical protein [Motilimonas eburnea]MCE2571743.1 hypothetical protein [Motilimonas eburnea]